MPRSHPVASIVAPLFVTSMVWFVVATIAAVNPVVPALAQLTAPAGLAANSDVAAMPVTLSAPTVSHPAPNRRESRRSNFI